MAIYPFTLSPSNAGQLCQECQNVSLPVTVVTSNPTQVFIETSVSLTGPQYTTLQGVVAAHVPVDFTDSGPLITLNGDVTGSGFGAVTTSLKDVLTPAPIGTTAVYVDSKGRVLFPLDIPVIGVTAAGAGLVNATDVSSQYGFIEVTTVAAGTGIKLSSPLAKARVTVYNGGANDLRVYPTAGCTIDGSSTYVTMYPGDVVVFHGVTNTNWRQLRGGFLPQIGESYLASSYVIVSANGTYTDTGLGITLPVAGTYLISGDILTSIGYTAGPNAYMASRLYDFTNSAYLTNSDRVLYFSNLASAEVRQMTIPISMLVTVTSSVTLKLHVARFGATTWSSSQIASSSGGWTRLGYQRVK